MATFDGHKNFAETTIATAPSPALSGTSCQVAATTGVLLPAPPFNATVWPAGVLATSANAEIVRVSAVATDTLTIARAQEGTSAISIATGYQIAACATAKTFTDIEAICSNAGMTSSVTVANTASVSTLLALTIPANQVAAGQSYRITCWGNQSSTGTPTLTFSTRYGGTGGTVLATSPAISTTGSAVWPFKLEAYIDFQSTTVASCFLKVDFGTSVVATGTGQSYILTPSSTTAVTTTGSNALGIYCAWSAPSASNTLTITGGFTERLS